MAFPGGFLYNRDNNFSKEVPQLQELVSYLAQAADLCRKYGLSAQELEQDARAVQTYHVRVAVLGAFNTGKSALFNALLGTPLVQVSLEEETVLPVEAWYGTEGIMLLRAGRLSRSDPAVLRAGGPALAGAELARASLPLPSLAGRPGLSLLDTPGIGTRAATHAAGLSALIRQAGAYLLVFGADAPVITESMAAVLSTLPLTSKPLLCVLTKCDQFSESQLQAITDYLEQSLARQLGLEARLCRVCATADPQLGGIPAFLDELQIQAGALQAAEAKRCLQAGITPLMGYLEERLRSSRLLESELARKAELLDQRLAQLHGVVDEMNDRAARLLTQRTEEAVRRCRETLAPLAQPLADLLAAGQDPAPFADSAVLSVLRAEARSQMLPVLEAYERAMRRVAGLYSLTLPAEPAECEELLEANFAGTGTLLADAAPDALLDTLERAVQQCLEQGGQDAFARMRDTLCEPLYDQLASLRKALEDTRRQQQAQTEARDQSLEELQADLDRLRQMVPSHGEEDADDV